MIQVIENPVVPLIPRITIVVVNRILKVCQTVKMYQECKVSHRTAVYQRLIVSHIE